MIMSIKEVQQCFEKIVKDEIGADGRVTVDSISLMSNSYVMIIGDVGKIKPDGKNDWSSDYMLNFRDGQSLDFIKGMFYKALLDILED